MRLIDADKLKAMFEKFYCDREDVVEMLLSDVDFQPTVDPVKHGHWSQYAEPHEDGKGLYICSVCNEMYVMYDDEYKFCPSCGAKMDKKEE